MSELRQIISKGEGLKLDFKFSIDDKRKIARTLVAFANSEGGSLLIGVKDNGKIVGVNPEEEFHMIDDAASTYCKPPINFESKIWQEKHHLVLEIEVYKSITKHKAKDEQDAWRSYIRVEDHSLLGNNILDKVWELERAGFMKPKQFDEFAIELLNVIREIGPVSISKLYRSCQMKMNRIDSTLATFVYCKVVKMDISENGTTYSLIE